MTVEALLRRLDPLVEPDSIRIDGNRIRLDADGHIIAEVTDTEIRLYTFGLHNHFPTHDPREAELALRSLSDLLTAPLVRLDTFAGSRHLRRSWYFLRSGDVLESLAEEPLATDGGNPFARRSITRSCWQYDRAGGRYQKTSDDAVGVLALAWDLMATIRRASGGKFCFHLHQCRFEESLLDFVWAPLALPDALFDSVESAGKGAKAAAKQFRRTHRHDPFLEHK